MALGDYYIENGQYPKAVDPYEEALHIASSCNFPRLMEKALLNLSECWKKLGEKEKYIKMLGELQQLRLRDLEVMEV